MGRPPKPEPEKTWKVAPTAIPATPSELTGIALDEWDRIAKYLVALERVARLDRQTLAVYCMSWQRFYYLSTEVMEPWAALSVPGPRCIEAHPIIHPLLSFSRKTLKMAGLFGLTARTRDLDGTHGNRKASTLKRLYGNRRKVAAVKIPSSVVPMLPGWEPEEVAPLECMSPRAKAEYLLIGQELSTIDLYTPLDRVPLAIGAIMYDLYLRAGEQINNHYVTITQKVGEDFEEFERSHPLLKVQQDIFEVLHMVWKDYGQTARYRRLFTNEKPVERTAPMIFRGRLAQ